MIAMAQLMGQRTHAGEGAVKVCQHTALAQAMDKGTEGASTLARRGHGVNPSVLESMINKFAHFLGKAS